MHAWYISPLPCLHWTLSFKLKILIFFHWFFLFRCHPNARSRRLEIHAVSGRRAAVLSVVDFIYFMCSWNNSSVHIDSTMWSICLWDLLKPHETTNPYQSYVPGWVIEFRVSTPCRSDCLSLKVRQPRRIFYVASLAKACFTKGRVANGCTVAECEQHNKAICQRLDSDFKVQFIYLL